MNPTRFRDVAGISLLIMIGSYLLITMIYRWFPPITVYTGISLAILAGGEAIWGYYISHKIHSGEIGLSSPHLHPVIVARSVIAAKASAWAGGIICGFWIGILGYLLLQRSQLRIANQDTPGALIAAISALALLLAALWLQHCCKSPPDPREDHQLSDN